MSELRRAAEAVWASQTNASNCTVEVSFVALEQLEAALSAPDELAEARRLIAILENSGVNRDVRSEARDFLKRTE